MRLMPTLTLRHATESDFPAILTLLERSGLPTADLVAARPEFLLARDGSALVGIGALQRFGCCALLRSLAVEANRRSIGVGRMLVAHLEARARAQGISEIVLLTQTATPFFQRLGYRIVPRAEVPAAVQAGEEFRTLCPSSADCLVKPLRPAHE